MEELVIYRHLFYRPRSDLPQQKARSDDLQLQDRINTEDMQSAARLFFSSPNFAVAGASSTPSKFGHKIFAWYLDRKLPAVPLNPTCSEVEARGRKYKTIQRPREIQEPARTSLSIITQPKITAMILKEAKEMGVAAVWLQPGSFTDKELDYALKEFPGAAIGGFAEGTVGGEGWCVLVDGDAAIQGAHRESKL